MRVIRPMALATNERRRALVLALSMLAVGILAGLLTFVVAAGSSPVAIGLMGAAAALGLGVGSAWLVRAIHPDRTRSLTSALVELLAPTFDDSYTLVVAPRLPIRDAIRLDGILVGPAGVRLLTGRDWEGRYRVRGRGWEFDAHGRRGWIRCRTNPSFDAEALAEGFTRWATESGFRDLPVRGAVAFPHRHSRVVLEEPLDEVVTTDNAPWWANTIGRVRRLDPPTAARLLESILDAAEHDARTAPAVAVNRPS